MGTRKDKLDDLDIRLNNLATTCEGINSDKVIDQNKKDIYTRGHKKNEYNISGFGIFMKDNGNKILGEQIFSKKKKPDEGRKVESVYNYNRANLRNINSNKRIAECSKNRCRKNDGLLDRYTKLKEEMCASKNKIENLEKKLRVANNTICSLEEKIKSQTSNPDNKGYLFLKDEEFIPNSDRHIELGQYDNNDKYLCNSSNTVPGLEITDRSNNSIYLEESKFEKNNKSFYSDSPDQLNSNELKPLRRSSLFDIINDKDNGSIYDNEEKFASNIYSSRVGNFSNFQVGNGNRKRSATDISQYTSKNTTDEVMFNRIHKSGVSLGGDYELKLPPISEIYDIRGANLKKSDDGEKKSGEDECRDISEDFCCLKLKKAASYADRTNNFSEIKTTYTDALRKGYDDYSYRTRGEIEFPKDGLKSKKSIDDTEKMKA
ncbi:hypothetical protein AYI69_g9496 [Smittium culicis]|uniref:Uncharacterized protein n=1 Tax=Smittium culicis TaxID=133412 RepID=A0A1R1XC71_9FUNG|nr:hypothetical protein AYI69_g9496 [Smittium culicis]